MIFTRPAEVLLERAEARFAGLYDFAAEVADARSVNRIARIAESLVAGDFDPTSDYTPWGSVTTGQGITDVDIRIPNIADPDDLESHTRLTIVNTAEEKFQIYGTYAGTKSGSDQSEDSNFFAERTQIIQGRGLVRDIVADLRIFRRATR